MIKKLFDWTPRDIAYWEKIQGRGLGKFILVYGVVVSGSVLFLCFGFITLFNWIRNTAGLTITSSSLIYLAEQMIFDALVAIVCGVINSLITWAVEQRLYRKYKGSQA